MESLKDNKGTPTKRTGTKDSTTENSHQSTNMVHENSNSGGNNTKVNELVDAGLKITKTQ